MNRFKRRRLRRKARAIKYCGGMCALCKKQFPHYIYEFHHIKPRAGDESQTVGSMFHRTWNYIKKNLVDVILLCANCHKRIHHLK